MFTMACMPSRVGYAFLADVQHSHLKTPFL
jgi:hypothetical protein